MAEHNTDHALAIIKAGLSAIPVVGGSVASLVGDYIPSATQRSIDESLAAFTYQITALTDRIDVETVNKNEFSELFKTCYLVMTRTHHEAKLNAAASILANSLLHQSDPAKLSYTELDHFSRCIDALSSGAVEVLAVTVDFISFFVGSDAERSWVSFKFKDLHERVPHFDAPLLMGLVSELAARNLFHVRNVPKKWATNYATYEIQLTVLGTRLVSLLQNAADDKASSKPS